MVVQEVPESNEITRSGENLQGLLKEFDEIEDPLIENIKRELIKDEPDLKRLKYILKMSS